MIRLAVTALAALLANAVGVYAFIGKSATLVRPRIGERATRGLALAMHDKVTQNTKQVKDFLRRRDRSISKGAPEVMNPPMPNLAKRQSLRSFEPERMQYLDTFQY